MTDFQVPDIFKKKGGMASVFAGLNPSEDNLSEGIGQSYGVIGYKGKTWTLRYRGTTHMIPNPKDGTPASYIDVIILDHAKTKSKSYYAAFKQGQSEGERPICASINGVVPDPDVSQKQADNCTLCPRNEWKLNATTGRKGRECTDYKRLAVLILPPQTIPLVGGVGLLEPVFLRVPPDSLNSLAVMGEAMGREQYHFSSYITRITFDPQKAHPSMEFRPIQGLSDDEGPVVLEMRSHPLINRIIGGDQLHTNGMTQMSGSPSATGPTAVVNQAPSQPLKPATPTIPQGRAPTRSSAPGTGLAMVTMSPSSNGMASAPPATLGLNGSAGGGTAPATQTSGGANIVSAGAPQSAAVPMEDAAGDPGLSDEDLDAQIAALMK